MSEFNLFLAPTALLCAVMAVVMAFRAKSRGPAAWVMSIAFLILGATLLLIQVRAPMMFIGLGGVALVGLLLADFALRAGRQRGGPS